MIEVDALQVLVPETTMMLPVLDRGWWLEGGLPQLLQCTDTRVRSKLSVCCKCPGWNIPCWTMFSNTSIHVCEWFWWKNDHQDSMRWFDCGVQYASAGPSTNNSGLYSSQHDILSSTVSVDFSWTASNSTHTVHIVAGYHCWPVIGVAALQPNDPSWIAINASAIITVNSMQITADPILSMWGQNWLLLKTN